jgi:hypothetical protein
MSHVRLILVLSSGILVVALAFMAPHHTRRDADDFSTPLLGRAPLVSSADLVAGPNSFHRRRIVLEGIWHRAFEVSRLEVVEGQTFSIWLDVWDSKEFASESKEFVDPVMPALTVHADSKFRIRAEGSFYHRPRPGGGGFGHLGGSEALFVVDRPLALQLIPEDEPNKAPEPTPTSVTPRATEGTAK